MVHTAAAFALTTLPPAFPVASCSAGSVIFHVLGHRFVEDLFGEEEGQHFFKLHPQLFWDFNVHFRESKPGSGFQIFCKAWRDFGQFVIMHDPIFSTWHFSQHCQEIECTDVVTYDALAQSQAAVPVQSDACHTSFMVPRKHQALTTHDRIPYASLLGLYSFGAALVCASQQVMQAHTGKADGIF